MKNTSLVSRIIAVSLLASAVAFISSCTTQTTLPQATRTVTGTVQNSDGYAVPQAYVQALTSAQAQVASDSSSDVGAFKLTGLPEDISTLTLRTTHPAYGTKDVSFSSLLTGGSDTGTIAPVVMSNDSSCCGQANLYVESVSGPVGNATVQLRSGVHTVASGLTTQDGWVRMHHLCPGEYNFRISKDGYEVIEQSFVIQDCDSVDLVDTLIADTTEHDSCCNGVFRITVTDSATGNELGSGTVTMTRSGVTHTAEINDGVAIFSGVCTGQYAFRISNSLYHVQEFTETMHCGDTIQMHRQLIPIASNGSDTCCSGSLTVIVHDSATNGLLSHATVALYLRDSLLTQQVTDNGEAVFHHLCNGFYEIMIERDRYVTQTHFLSLGCGDTNETSVVLSPSSHPDSCCQVVLHCTVTDSSSHTQATLSDVSVSLSYQGQVIAHGTTNADGVWSADGICNNRTYVLHFERAHYQSLSVEWRVTDCKVYNMAVGITEE